MRWQYRVVDLGMFWQRDRLVGALAGLGSSGWELVAIYDKSSNWLQGLEKGFALFKRAVPDGQDPDGPWAETSYAEDLDERAVRAGAMTETECLSCGASMPLGEDTCEVCGWSYSDHSAPSTKHEL